MMSSFWCGPSVTVCAVHGGSIAEQLWLRTRTCVQFSVSMIWSTYCTGFMRLCRLAVVCGRASTGVTGTKGPPSAWLCTEVVLRCLVCVGRIGSLLLLAPFVLMLSGRCPCATQKPHKLMIITTPNNRQLASIAPLGSASLKVFWSIFPGFAFNLVRLTEIGTSAAIAMSIVQQKHLSKLASELWFVSWVLETLKISYPGM